MNFREFLMEGFVSNLTNLSKEEVQKALGKVESGVSIREVKFLKLEKTTDAVYAVLWYDNLEDEYSISKCTFISKQGKGIELEDYTSTPEFSSDDKNEAKNYLKKIK